MKIRVDRDSVCMVDDVLPHEVEFEVPEDMTVKEFFDFLEKERYLPSVQGIMWSGNFVIEMVNKVFISPKHERLSIRMRYIKRGWKELLRFPYLFCSIIVPLKHIILEKRIDENCRL